MSLDRSTLFIGGEWVAPATDETFTVISPHTEEPIATVPAGSTADIDRAVAAAREAFDHGPWPRMTPQERIDVVARFSDLYAAKLGEAADLITAEMGSPAQFSQLAQSPAAWMALDAMINVARAYEWEATRPGSLGNPVVVRREPVGVVAAIPPWNVPHFTVMSKLAPALLAGCTIVVKPAPETPLSGAVLADLLTEAGVPAGVVSIIPGGREVGAHLVAHPGVDKVAFTGSTAAGRQIAAVCGQQLKRVSLELGGKSAAIVLDDADLDRTIEGLKFASLLNSGQACIAQTRILVSRARHDDFVEAFADAMGKMVVGDPADLATEIGPMVSQRQQQRVESYIGIGQSEGAKMVLGGEGRPTGLDRGWYVKPTLFAGVDNSMRIAQEEIFGPVLAVVPYDDPAEAVRIANDSPYGLGGSVWTSDPEQGLEVARQIRAGTVGVNQYMMDFAAPFGGFKDSGIGREFGPEGLDEYVEAKSMFPDVSGG
ncbi:aldehyde dehydrogenase [Nocardioides limicola]|uniref:aldehyde dehydrogenase n=1 Tax=Nocardioides limicola TaxID=2803368 RepID=UPI00193AECF5|nr:aldehyde dehydrogenase [Nocardioides sp. DJM-14]